MTYALGARSLKNLEGVHPDLVRVVKRAIQITTQDFTVICGVRTLAEQKRLYAKGRTEPGPVVTWTLKSRHLPVRDTKTGGVYGRAVDMPPFPINWDNTKENLARFDAVAKAMFEASRELGVPIRWGGDWNANGTPRERGESDSPHFELA